MLVLKAVLLGIVEGVTEFLPVSSTGHLIVVSALIDYPEASRATFDIFIQLGAILAVVWNYRQPLGTMVATLPSKPASQALAAQVLLAFFPAALAGFLFHRAIEAHLFSPTVVAVTLIAGGVFIVLIERRQWRFDVHTIDATTWRHALIVGLAQVLSLIPGMSRAATTILGGMFAGMNRPASTQFSFYLSIPTLCAASLYSLFKARNDLTAADAVPLAVGFVFSFLSALLVVRAFIGFVQRHTFTGFGYYRIAIGVVLLLILH